MKALKEQIETLVLEHSLDHHLSEWPVDRQTPEQVLARIEEDELSFVNIEGHEEWDIVVWDKYEDEDMDRLSELISSVSYSFERFAQEVLRLYRAELLRVAAEKGGGGLDLSTVELPI